MKLKNIAALILALVACLLITACNNTGSGDATTVKPAVTTAKPEGTTAKPAETTAKPAETTAAVTTAAPGTTAEVTTEGVNKVGELSGAELQALKDVLPVLLPDGTDYTFTRGMCLDNGLDEYYISGNSAMSAVFVGTDEGAIYGKGIKFAGKADASDKRGEITIQSSGLNDPEGARGVLFYVDFSHIIPQEGAEQCVSVTFNTNTYRAQGPDKSVTGNAVTYYYENGAWVQTTNINACRQRIPTGFKGWLYFPATAFYQDQDGLCWDTATNKFVSIFVENMRCYTDGYTYSADSYVIFDEILYVY